MNKITINNKEINFFIDYIRIPNKYNHDYSLTSYDYNCDLNIVVDKSLPEYEKEVLCRFIREKINSEI